MVEQQRNQEEPPTPVDPPNQQDLAEQQQQQPDDEQQTIPENISGSDDGDQGGDDELRQTFDREYVEQLRTKSAGYRLRAKEAEQQLDTTRRALFQERLARLDMVVDNEAVPYDPALLDDEQALVEHIEQLLQSKPYLRKRRIAGNIGQHTNNDQQPAFSLSEVLRQNAS